MMDLKEYCRECGKVQNSDVLFECEGREPVYELLFGPSKYRVVRCRGCDFVSLTISRGVPFSDENDSFAKQHYPSRKKRMIPERLVKFFLDENNQDISNLFHELYAALESELYVLTAIALRTVFDRITLEVGVDPKLPFSKKLDAVFDRGYIGKNERLLLDVLVDAGSAAVHRGWRPSEDTLLKLFEILEPFAARILVDKQEIHKIKGEIPSRE